MNKQTKKDFFIIGGFVAAFLVLLIAARQAPQTDRVIGGQWCGNKGQALDKVLPGKTRRPPYHQGEFKAQTKLTIICKKKALH